MRKKRLRSSVPRVRLSALWLAAALLFMLPLNNASGLVIDDWQINQTGVTIDWDGLVPLPVSLQNSVASTELHIIGAERDIQTNLIDGTQPGLASSKAELGAYIVGFETTLFGNSIVQWDGADGSPVLNPVGLGCKNLLGEGDALTLPILSDDLPCVVVVNVYTDASNWSTHTINLPGGIFVTTPFVLAMPGDFTVGGGAGADFSCVGAITLQVTPLNPQIGALDMSLGPISVDCSKSCTCTLIATPPAPLVGDPVTLSWSVSTFSHAIPAEDDELVVASTFGAAVPPLTPLDPNGQSGSVVVVPPSSGTVYSLTGQNGCGPACPCSVPVNPVTCDCPPVNILTVTPSKWDIGTTVHLCWDTTQWPGHPGVVHVNAPGYGPGVNLPEDGCIDFVADQMEYCVDSINDCDDAPQCHMCRQPPPPIPTLSTLGIGILAVLMAGSALLLVKRKRSIG